MSSWSVGWCFAGGRRPKVCLSCPRHVQHDQFRCHDITAERHYSLLIVCQQNALYGESCVTDGQCYATQCSPHTYWTVDGPRDCQLAVRRPHAARYLPTDVIHSIMIQKQLHWKGKISTVSKTSCYIDKQHTPRVSITPPRTVGISERMVSFS